MRGKQQQGSLYLRQELELCLCKMRCSYAQWLECRVGRRWRATVSPPLFLSVSRLSAFVFIDSFPLATDED